MQKLTKKQNFHELTSDEQYKLVHETELRVLRLERLGQGLLFWKEGSVPYKESEQEFKDYMEGGNNE